MGGATAQSACPGRNRSAQSHQNRKETKEGLEANGHQGLLRRRRLHPETSQIRAFYQTYGKITSYFFPIFSQKWLILITLFLFTVPTVGLAFQKGSRHTPRAEGHLLPPHPRREEEPLLAPLHLPGRHHQRNSGGGQCQRAGFGHTRRKSHLGWEKKRKITGLDSEIVFRQTVTIWILRWVVKEKKKAFCENCVTHSLPLPSR